MSIAAPRWRFTPAMLNDAPDWKGVYVLWSHARPLKVASAGGGAETLRSQLLAEYAHAAGGVTHYSWEICADPEARAWQLARQLGLAGREPQQQAA